MNHEDITTFLTVASEENITQASKILFLSQSTVSQRIKNIENEFNIKLFTRGKGIRKIQMTEQGKQFLILANQYIYVYDKMKEVQKLDSSKSLNIGGIDIVNAHIFYDFYRQLSKEDYKDIRLSISTYHSNELFHLMESKKLDMAFAYARYPSKEIISTPLFHEPMYLITSRESNFKNSKKSYKDFSRSDNIYLKWSSQFELWFANHWDFDQDPYIAVNTGNLLFKYLKDVKGSWTIAPLSVIKSFGEDKVNIHKLDIDIPRKVCFQLISKNLSSYKKSSYRIFQKKLIDYLNGLDYLKSYENTLTNIIFE